MNADFLNIHKLKVIRILDFVDMPILTLETDPTGRYYLSYLIEWNDDDAFELRAILPVSDKRLNKIINKQISIYNAFKKHESELYIAKYNLETGDIIEVTNNVTADEILKEISPNYDFTSADLYERIFEVERYAKIEHKRVLDLYVKAKDLTEELKIWVLSLANDFLSLVKNITGIKLDEFPIVITQGSLGLTILMDYEPQLFETAEQIKIRKLIKAFEINETEELKSIFQDDNDKLKKINSYVKLLKKITRQDDSIQVQAAFSDPETDISIYGVLDRPKAKRIIEFIQRTTLQETEYELTGHFLKVDFKRSRPSFVFEEDSEGVLYKGIIVNTLIEKLKEQNIKVPTQEYKIKIKEQRKLKVDIEEEEIKYFLIDVLEEL